MHRPSAFSLSSSRVDARFCFISNSAQSDALIFYPFPSYFPFFFCAPSILLWRWVSLCLIRPSNPLSVFCFRLSSSRCSSAIVLCLWLNKQLQTTRLPRLICAASQTCTLFDYLAAALTVSCKPGSNSVPFSEANSEKAKYLDHRTKCFAYLEYMFIGIHAFSRRSRLSSFPYNKSLYGMFVFNLTRKAIVQLTLELLVFNEFQTVRYTYS